MKSVAVMVMTMLGVGGCVSIPRDAFRPSRTYASRFERLSVAGFEGQQWVQTGAQFASIHGPAVSGTYSGVSGQIVPTSDRTAMRHLLENTGCIRVVEESTGTAAADRLEGKADAQFHRTALGVLESITLLPLFGLPVQARVEGYAVGRLYSGGQLVGSYQADHDFYYWTTIYSLSRDKKAALSLAKGKALVELADRVSADLCRE